MLIRPTFSNAYPPSFVSPQPKGTSSHQPASTGEAKIHLQTQEACAKPSCFFYTSGMPKTKTQSSSPRQFLLGLILGLTLGAGVTLVLLGLPDEGAAPVAVAPTTPTTATTSTAGAEVMDWSFYDLFPKAEVATVGGYQSAKDSQTPPPVFHLQTGSFSTSRDADERRAALLLLGLPAFIEPKVVNNQTWYRVLVGPIETETSLNRVQALLANNDFESMPISAR
jgi:hypothetical protein